MQNQNTEEKTSVVQGLTLAHEIGQFTADLDVGIAIYSKDYVLVTANDAFYELHSVTKEDIGIGSSMRDLMRYILMRKKHSENELVETYQRWVGALKKYGKYSRDVQNEDGKLIRISRAKRANGMILEIVQAKNSDANALHLPTSSSLSHAHRLTLGSLMESIDSMSDGFGIFDKSGELIAFNKKYVSLNPSIKNHIKIGAAHHELMSAIYDKGEINFGQMTKSDFLTLAEKERLSPSGATTHQNSDGTWVRFSGRRLDDGSTVFTCSDVTQLKEQISENEKLGKTVQVQQDRIEIAFSSMSQGLCMFDEAERVMFMNQQYADLTGIDEEHQTPGKTRLELLVNTMRHSTLSRNEMSEYITKFEREGFPKQEATYLHELGNGKIMEVFNKPLDDGRTIVTASDVTEREANAATITEQQRQIDHAIGNMAQGMCLFDADDRVVMFNDKFVDMTGADPKVATKGVKRVELVQSAVKFGTYSEAVAEKILKGFQEKNFYTVESRDLLHRDNGRIYEIYNQPLADGGSMVLVSDVTVREKNAVRIERYTKSLERSNAELQDFAYVASHDLQEPLRKIEAFGDRLVKKYGEQIPEDGQMYLDRMQNAASRMRQLINDLLSYSRVTSKARPFEPTDLNDVVSGVLSDIQMRLEESGGTVDVQGLETVDCDAMQMRQLFQNLISNALKFIKEDTVPLIKVHGELKSTEDAMGNPVHMHQIKIMDNGIGFDNRFKDQIFAIFKRLHGRMDYEGTGIGLSTCRKIVERHNGTIDADGVPDVGATFIIELPVAHKNAEEL